MDILIATHTITATIMSTKMQTSSLLNLLHISSPALPIGAFAYSQGLEYTLEAGWCKSADDVEQWIKSVMTQGLGGVDLPILKRLHQAWAQNDEQALQYWNAMLLAFRETKELYLEDIQVGDALSNGIKLNRLGT